MRGGLTAEQPRSGEVQARLADAESQMKRNDDLKSERELRQEYELLLIKGRK